MPIFKISNILKDADLWSLRKFEEHQNENIEIILFVLAFAGMQFNICIAPFEAGQFLAKIGLMYLFIKIN